MEQISMFGPIISYPQTYSDVERMFYDYIFEGENDDDVFTYNDIKNGRSYFFYGEKVFSFYPSANGGPKIRLWLDKKEKTVSLDELNNVLEELKMKKKAIFRETITEVFGCCNDFKRCSAVGQCLHQEDRFYNGCYYRENLEAGRNFYREV